MEQQQESTQEVIQTPVEVQNSPKKSSSDDWQSSPKAKEIIADAERSSQQEQPDHRSSPDVAQENIDSSPHESTMDTRSDDGHASEESPIEAGVKASDDQVVSDIPDWGKKDPAAYRRYQDRMKEKEKQQKESREAQLQQEVDHYKSLIESSIRGQSPEQSQYNNENIVIDPKSGMQIDVTTPEGGALLNELRLEAARDQFNGNRVHQEYERLKDKQERLLVDKMEEAKFKYNDYESVVIDNGKKFTQQMIDMAAILTDNDDNPNNKNKNSGADFLYYLGKNQRELNRINELNPYDQFKVLIKHAIDFNKNIPQKSNAPEPVKPLARGSVPQDSLSSYESAKALMKKKYCK